MLAHGTVASLLAAAPVDASPAHKWIAILTLLGATLLFITRKLPLAMTALAIPVVLFSTGVIKTPEQALAGFGNQAALAIGAIMVIGAALRESGVATLMARGLQRVGGRSEARILVLMMAATSFLAVFMNNTAVVAIFLPVAAALSKRADIPVSRILMPMAFAAVLGGTVSLIGTAPNFLAADYYNNNLAPGQEPLGVFDYALVGIPITVTGILFMLLIGRHLLPDRSAQGGLSAMRLPEDAAASYRIPEQLFKVRIIEASKIAGKTIAEAAVRERYGLGIIMIRRPVAIGDRWLQPAPDLVLQPEDRMYVEGKDEDVWALCEMELAQFGLPSDQAMSRLLGHGTSLAEVTISPHSRALGQSFRELDFRKTYGLNVLGLWRRGAPIKEGVPDVKLQLGDAFLVSGAAREVGTLEANPNFIVLTDRSQDEDVTRAPLAILWLLIALIPPVFFKFPLQISALGAALGMVLTGCLERGRLLRSIDWSVLALIVGTLPLGTALYETGIAGSIAGSFTAIRDATGMVGVYAALFLGAATLSVLASNAAAAVIMAPVAAGAAELLQIDPKQALLAMAYGCSCNFLLPFAQCNLLVMSPGGYDTRDYVRVGIGMSIVMAITTITMLTLMG